MKKTFEVELQKTVYRVFTVIAETETEAVDKAFYDLEAVTDPSFTSQSPWEFSDIEEAQPKTEPETKKEPQP
jgi:hypothetical protein